MIKTITLEPGGYYHIYNRGNNKEITFKEVRNYAHFLNLWKKHISPVADTFAYCLLGNHFHALVKIKETVSAEKKSEVARMNQAEQQFANFFNAYAKGYNKSYGRTGKLFEERFKRKPVLSSAYFTQLIYYIHANPQKHGFVDDFREYPHSSFQSLLSDKKTMLKREEVLDWFGSKSEFESFHKELHRRLSDMDQYLMDDEM